MTRDVEQGHKFDPKAIPGIFAGYAVSAGMNWSGHYKVWSLDEFTQQYLAFNAERPIHRLLKPHTVRHSIIISSQRFLREDQHHIGGTQGQGPSSRRPRDSAGCKRTF